MHGGIFCALFKNKDEYTGHMFCKKCGRPNEKDGDIPQRNSLVLIQNTQSRSAQLEKIYLQDPRHWINTILLVLCNGDHFALHYSTLACSARNTVRWRLFVVPHEDEDQCNTVLAALIVHTMDIA